MSQAYAYKPELLAPYLALDQGESIQAECKPPIHHIAFRSRAHT
jgi:hypothetical protein